MSIPDPTDPRAVVDDPSGIVQQMPDENNTPEMPDRIWAWSEDDDFLRAKPHGVMHGTEYIRADRAAPEGQVRRDAHSDIGILLAQIDWLQDCLGETLENEDAALVAQIRADWSRDTALTPPPAAPMEICSKCMGTGTAGHPDSGYTCDCNGGMVAAPTDNTALVGAAKAAVAAWLEDGLEVGRTMLKLSETLDALASREAPPACQQEAVAEADLAAARAENERLTKERDNLSKLEQSHREQANEQFHRANKAEAERDEARASLRHMEGFDCCTCGPCAIHGSAMLADAERDMRQRAADTAREAWRDGYDATPHILALPLKHADQEEGK